MELIITILPVVTKDLPISPRFTPVTIFFRDASSALLQLVNQGLDFTYYSRSDAFRYGRKNTNPTLVRIELRCAGYLLDHSGDELLLKKNCVTIEQSRSSILYHQADVYLEIRQTKAHQ